MKTAEFIDYIIEQTPASAGDTADFFKHMMADNSDAMLEQAVTRKKAAMIIYAFMKDVLKWQDVDWGKTKVLRDIYDCRICANAIAQVCERGILTPEREDLFGGEILMKEDDLYDAISRLMGCII